MAHTIDQDTTASEPQMRIIQRHYITVAEDIIKSSVVSQYIVCFVYI